MQRCLRNQIIIIITREIPRLTQRGRNDAYGLELCARVTDGILVNGECLCEVFVRDVFEPGLVCDLSAGNEQAETEFGGGGGYAGVQGADGLVQKAVERGGLRRPIFLVVFAGFEAAGEFEGDGDERGNGIFDALVAFEKGFLCSLQELFTLDLGHTVKCFCTYLQLRIIIWSLDVMCDPCQPSLLLNNLVAFPTSPLRLQIRISDRLLHALLDQHTQDLQNTFQILRRRDLGLIPQNAAGDFARHRSSRLVRLASEERDVVWEGECGEEGHVVADRREEQAEQV